MKYIAKTEQLVLFTDDMKAYLNADEIVNYEHLTICDIVEKLSKQAGTTLEYIQLAYEFVRDNIAHSADILHDQITCTASEVLEAGHGICFAKANLLAALLRKKGIPAGFCYQKLILDDETAPYLIFHGLNGVYIEELGKWIRLDARGNKNGVQAEFSTVTEKLAFPVREEYGEEDVMMVFPDPDYNIIKSLKENKSRSELWRNLPRELHL